MFNPITGWKKQKCVGYILKYTTDIEYELILVDNGSNDGTLDYFKSINHPRKKIIRVTKNIGSLVPIIMNQWTGRYLAFITNDTYVTKNWLTNLLACMKSKDEIGLAVPASSNVSNLQEIGITFDTLDEMQEKAAKNNISDPRLWHERIRILPIAALFRREALDIAGWMDYGFFHDFSDDDISFRFRRAGFKVMFCKDTFVHHDHVYSNPGEKNREEFARSLEAGRKDFQKKYYGLDAWDDVNNYETSMMSLVDTQELNSIKRIEILGMDVLCGTPILELKNKLREGHIDDVRLSAFSTDPKYWLDLKTICSGNVVVDQIDQLNTYFENESFDFVVLGKPINTFPNPYVLLKNLLKLLKRNGYLLLKLYNTSDIISVLRTLGANIQITTTNPINNVYKISLDELAAQLGVFGFIPKKIVVENWPLGENFHKVLQNTIAASGLGNNPDNIFAGVNREYIIEIPRK